MQKQVWEAPKLEVLNVSETASGIGLTKVDFTYVNGKLVDMDIYS